MAKDFKVGSFTARHNKYTVGDIAREITSAAITPGAWFMERYMKKVHTLEERLGIRKKNGAEPS